MNFSDRKRGEFVTKLRLKLAILKYLRPLCLEGSQIWADEVFECIVHQALLVSYVGFGSFLAGNFVHSLEH